MQYPSTLIEDAVTEISRLPGIGKKTALRLALHLLKQDVSITEDLSEALLNLRNKTKYCKICHIISDSEDCTCESIKKDRYSGGRSPQEIIRSTPANCLVSGGCFKAGSTTSETVRILMLLLSFKVSHQSISSSDYT